MFDRALKFVIEISSQLISSWLVCDNTETKFQLKFVYIFLTLHKALPMSSSGESLTRIFFAVMAAWQLFPRLNDVDICSF